MKKKILLFSLIGLAAFATKKTEAQTNLAYAITGETKGSVNWTVVRQINLSTGALVKNIYVPSSDKINVLDAVSRKTIKPDGNTAQQPSMIAASAFDAKTNRLYFTPIFSNELRYLDLSTGTLSEYHFQTQLLKKFKSAPGEEDNITRMAIASDGFGYALTNNGNHLIKFTTGDKLQITDLGSMYDAAKNNISVHTRQQSWGGDMIADAFGNLFLFTMKGYVFKINPQTLIATHVGNIKDLPNDYTVNAAAVDKNGFVVISSALSAGAYYRVNLATFEAQQIKTTNNESVYNASDFANENLAYQNVTKTTDIINDNALVVIYPNPVTNNHFTVVFNHGLRGNHNIQLVTLSGASLLSKTVNVTADNQTENVNVPAATAKGLYILKVVGASGKEVFTNKVTLQ